MAVAGDRQLCDSFLQLTGGIALSSSKTVVRQAGAWLANYHLYPGSIALPLLAYVGVISAMLLAARGATLAAFVASSLAILGIIGTARHLALSFHHAVLVRTERQSDRVGQRFLNSP